MFMIIHAKKKGEGLTMLRATECLSCTSEWQIRQKSFTRLWLELNIKLMLAWDWMFEWARYRLHTINSTVQIVMNETCDVERWEVSLVVSQCPTPNLSNPYSIPCPLVYSRQVTSSSEADRLVSASVSFLQHRAQHDDCTIITLDSCTIITQESKPRVYP